MASYQRIVCGVDVAAAQAAKATQPAIVRFWTGSGIDQ